jgi:hypothetical protein
MYYDFDGNKYCESCGKARQQEVLSYKCPGCHVELGKLSDNHDTDACFRMNNELKQKKQFEENMDKFRKTQRDLKEFNTRTCPGGCGRKVKKNEICSFEDCVRQRGYLHLDESNLKFIQCVQCKSLHRKVEEGNSFFRSCANCKKSTD